MLFNKAWSESHWRHLDEQMVRDACALPSEERIWKRIVQKARKTLKTYSTSFFMVTRFLPRFKREQVEVIYAAVRFPDEIVDTFTLDDQEKLDRLTGWREHYRAGLAGRSLRDRLQGGVPPFMAAFSRVVRRHNIPPEHYESFLDAMVADIHPRNYDSLDDLIENYIYGSAVVVGYFLTYVYGAKDRNDFQRALVCARDLGIALQLTNFLRDIREDRGRRRLYLPLDILHAHHITPQNLYAPGLKSNFRDMISYLGHLTESYYVRAHHNLDAFAADSRIAIQACIDVYRQLNNRIMQMPDHASERASVPIREKFRVLPISKYWRLPIAYLYP
jgi:phytoene synthase